MEIEFTSAGYVERLESENAKLRDLLRRVHALALGNVVLPKGLWGEIKSAIEPSGETREGEGA